MTHTINQQRFRCFILFLLFLGGNVFNSQLIHAQTQDGDVLRIFAYDLHSTYTPIEGTELGTYTFYFKSNVPATSGKLYFYHGKTIDYIHEIKDGETVTSRDTIWQDKQVGEFDIPENVIAERNTTTGQYIFSLSKDQIPVDVTNKDAYLDMTWAIELQAEKITGRDGPIADLDWTIKGDLHYTHYSYRVEDCQIYNQVREPRLLMVDDNFRCPQGIAIDNNPQSPFFGRVYVANAPTDDNEYLSTNPYDAGVVVYEPDPKNGLYTKIDGSYMPSDVTFPNNIDGNTRFYMHRIAVNPTNGNVYYSKSTGSEQSAIYQLIPDKDKILTDNGTAINVTENLIPADDFASSELHPINSLAFGPGGELYVMSHASGTKEITAQTFAGATITDNVGTGVIYKLTKDDGDDRYDAYAQYYTPNTTPREVFDWTGTKIHEAEGLPFSVNPWVDADNAMVVTARGSFWVTQYRPEIDKYVFLAHIHPQGYIQGEQYGSSLSPYFQYSLGAEVTAETFSGNVVTPMWYARHMLSPHQHTSIIEANTYPSGHVAIYEKGGMKSTEAMLAVAFREKVCVFKLVYNDKNYEWFGFNLDWMFEIPIEGATFIDGLAFDYAGNLFVASESTHSLYVYSLPNYGMMKPDNNPPLQATNFDTDGYRQDIVYGDNYDEETNPNDFTLTSNNLNRGKPLDDNNVTTRAHLDLKVDGAIVYDERYFETRAEGEEDLTEFDAQWSTKSNWNIKRVPNSTDIPVVIRSNAVLDEKQSVSGMTIENNSQLTIARNGGLTIGEGGIKGASKKGVLTLENFSAIDGSDYYENRGAGYLRIHPSVTDMPKVTVHYHTKAQPSNLYPEENAHRLWQYVGAPGKGTIATSTSTTSLYQWKESEGGWVKKTDTRPMKPFVEGYAITQDGAPDYFWTTTAINADQSIPLSYTPDSYRNEGDEELISGQNVIANSYLAPINVAAFIDSDFSDNIVKTFYLFNTGSWTEWNNATKTEDNGALTDNQSSGQYTAIPISAAQNFDPSLDPTFIPPMSGIFVRTGSGGGTITFDYERLVWSWADSNGAANDPMYAPSRVAGQSQQTYAPELLRRIRIQAYGEGSGSDRMYIMQDTRCTSGYDNGWDGENMHAAGQVNIYTNEPCGKMEVSCSNSIDSMYIGFCAGADTIYTLRFTSLIGDSLYIKDLETDSIIALAEEGTYTFHAPAMSVNDMRFQVQLNPEFPAGHPNGNGNSGTTTAIDNVSSSKVWISDNIVYVSTGQEENIVVLCNMHGQVLYQHPFDYQTQLSMAGLPAGVYLMKINNEIYKFVRQ